MLRRRLPLWFRIGGLLALVIAFVVGLLSFLNYSNFCKTVQGLHQARYQVLGKDLRQTVEAGLALGLTPSQNARLPQLFAELKTVWPAIRYVGVVDPQGQPQVNAGQALTVQAAIWQARIADGKADAIWHWRQDQLSAIGLSIANSYGGKAGAVLLVYDDRELTTLANRMAQALLWRALGVILVAAILAWLGAWYLTRSLAQELDAAEAVLTGAVLPADERPLVAETQAFVAAARQAERALQEAAP